MTELQRYLAEEIAEDHADGLVSRREALRRLGLLGLGGAAAASLLTAIVEDDARAMMRVASGSAVAAGSSAPDIKAAALPTREIVFRGAGGRQLMGAWAPAPRPSGGVLVIHENRGLNDSIRSVAGRLAASGYSSLAIDLLSQEGGTGSFARDLRRARLEGQCHPRRGAYGAPQGRPSASDRHLPGRRPRVLQPHRVAVRSGRGGGRLSPDADLVWHARRELVDRRRHSHGRDVQVAIAGHDAWAMVSTLSDPVRRGWAYCDRCAGGWSSRSVSRSWRASRV